MRIGPNSQPAQPLSASAPVKAAAAESTSTPTMAGDFFSSDASAVNVATFNVAGGASGFKLEGALTDAPLFQKVIQGTPDAPIVACQETTPALAQKLIELSKNGNFQVIWPGHTWVPSWVPTSTLMQGNMLLVPKRYQVVSTDSGTFEGRAGKFFGALKDWLFGDGKANAMLLALQDRGYVTAGLKDTRTGKTFNVVATHIAYEDSVRRLETPQLVDVLNQAEAKGPTLLMGDFNAPTLDTNYHNDQGVVDFWNALEPLGLSDMGPSGKAGASFWKNGQDIDAVLASGFKSVSHQMLTGSEMTLPGHPDAQQVSDHYAEADSVTFA